jgi:hypothetical protein
VVGAMEVGVAAALAHQIGDGRTVSHCRSSCMALVHNIRAVGVDSSISHGRLDGPS